MLRNTSIAHFAVLAPHGSSDHARNAKMLLIKLPGFNKFVNDWLLLASTAALWNIARIFEHGLEVEKRTESVKQTEHDI